MIRKSLIKKFITYSLCGGILWSINISNIAYGSNNQGWIINDKGKWNYIDSNFNKYAGCWKYIDGYWYAFDISGNMRTGWYKEGDSWYYLDNSGVMKTGWINDGIKPYYLYPNGTMAVGWFEDGTGSYFADKDGNIQYGNIQIGGRNYSLTPKKEENKIIANADVIKAFTSEGLPISITYNSQNVDKEKDLYLELSCGSYYIGNHINPGSYKIICTSSCGKIRGYDKDKNLIVYGDMKYGEEKDNVLLLDQGLIEVVEGNFEFIYDE